MKSRDDSQSAFDTAYDESQRHGAPDEPKQASPARARRWQFVTGSVAAVVFGSVVLLAAQTMPPQNASGFSNASAEFLPYRLFRTLRDTGESFYASLSTEAREPETPARRQIATARQKTEDDGIENRTVTLESGDTLSGALEYAGVAAADAQAAVAALRSVFNPRSIRAGQAFDLRLEAAVKTPAGETAAQLNSLKFSPSIEHDVTVTRLADGSYVANDAVKQLKVRIHRAGTTIDSSLYISAMRAGIPADVVVEMIRMFSYKVDFQRDIHPGDSFEVYYDYFYTPKGQPARVGNVSFARMRLGGRDIAMYRHQPDPNLPADYFDPSGESAKGMLMKTPVDGARITSKFGRRHHPVLGYTRMHKGVDFGVPRGTPVMAAGSGTVQFAGWASGYGNFIVVRHGNGYATAYGHLSKLLVRRGQHVRQAQIIARSGNTGITTGPHLHYEIRVNGKQVNPLKVRVASGRKLKGAELRKYLKEKARIDAQMAEHELETKIADLSAGMKPSTN